MKEVVNTKIKFPEPFRAPSTQSSCATVPPSISIYPGVEQHEAPRYMLMVGPDQMPEKAGADSGSLPSGTGRLQTIERETTRATYVLIERSAR